jgi:hypothetical protein
MRQRYAAPGLLAAKLNSPLAGMGFPFAGEMIMTFRGSF